MSKYSKEVNKCLLKIQNNDLSQFEKLVDITFNHLLAVAKLYLVNKDFAEDVVYETYIKALTYIESFDRKQDGYNWLLKITQNVAKTYSLKNQKAQDAEQELLTSAPNQTYDLDTDNVDFFLGIGELDETDKQIAYRRFFLDETQEAIGNALNLSKTAVCQRIKKICKTFEKFYKNT